MNSVSCIPPLVLGSASPRRKRILRDLGYSFDVVAPATPEIHLRHDPVQTVVANALRKHDEVRRRRPDACRITADTLVFFQGETLGKPADIASAAAMLRAFSGTGHLVFTAMALSLPDMISPDLRVEAASVCFKTLDDGLIDRYLERTCPLDRAGAYDIDAHGDWLIARCDGSRTNVMGLPAETLSDWLLAHGVSPLATGWASDL